MISPNIRALAIGIAIIVAGHVAWAIALRSPDANSVLLGVAQFSPAIAAFCVAYLVPRKKVLLGMAMAGVAAAVSAAMYWASPFLGLPTDRIGLGPVLILSLGAAFVTAGVGALTGYFLSRTAQREG